MSSWGHSQDPTSSGHGAIWDVNEPLFILSVASRKKEVKMPSSHLQKRLSIWEGLPEASGRKLRNGTDLVKMPRKGLSEKMLMLHAYMKLN